MVTKENIKSIKENFNVYDYQYNYEQMKVMLVLANTAETKNLDYEDLCCICKIIYDSWNNDCNNGKIESKKEQGYIQIYTQRILLNIIELYKEN